MKIKSHEMLDQLQADVRRLILSVEYLKRGDDHLLTIQPAAGRWSVAHVLEHLNSYGRFYLPAISKSLDSSNVAIREWFVPGLMGEYFTRIMRPGKDGRIRNKMSAPKNHRPAFVADVNTVIAVFLGQQQILLNLLEQAREKDIAKLRTPISISRFIRLKTGDVFRFLIAHEQRHFVQIENTLRQVQSNSQTALLASITK